MNVAQVVNVREVNLRDPDVVRIDRLSAWGSPFLIGRDGDRAQVVRSYRWWIAGMPDLLAALPSLEGKRLACWCAPLPCHGDVLVELLTERQDRTALAPVDPVAEGWAWMLTACSTCGRNTIYEAGVCSCCRLKEALE